MRWVIAAAVAAATLAVVPGAARAQSGANDFACKPTADHPRPVVLVHGLGARADHNWSYHAPRLKAAGFCLFALTYGVDPRTATWPHRPGGTIPMERSARELQAFVARVLEATGAERIDLVGHSEGTVMPRFWLERLGGAALVARFVALTPLWRGTNPAQAATLRDLGGASSGRVGDLVGAWCGACPQLLRGSDYLNDLNADGEAVPGIEHTNIVTRYDQLVVPYTSGLMLDGGSNIVLQDLCPANVSEHAALAFDPVVTRLVLNALDPGHAQPVRCT